MKLSEKGEYGDAPVEWKEAEVSVESFTVKHHGEWKERGKVTSVSRLKCQVLKNQSLDFLRNCGILSV